MGDKRYGPKKQGAGHSHRDGRTSSYPRFDAPKPAGAIRLNRFIANSGICSRREADDLITAGLVAVNGQIVTELGSKVNPDDEVRFNGSVIKGEKKVYIVMNKPKGFVTSLDDPACRQDRHGFAERCCRRAGLSGRTARQKQRGRAAHHQ